jgi:hypothetical protein
VRKRSNSMLRPQSYVNPYLTLRPSEELNVVNDYYIQIVAVGQS